jgi:hypothetical protein
LIIKNTRHYVSFIEAPYCRSWTNVCSLPLLWLSQIFSKVFRKCSPETRLASLSTCTFFLPHFVSILSLYPTNTRTVHTNTTHKLYTQPVFIHYMFRPYVLAIIRWTVAAWSTHKDIPGTFDKLCTLFLSFSVISSIQRIS